MNVPRAVVMGGLALALGVPLAMALRKERVIAAGTPVLLRLAPVDPRSLIQGDYMALDYAVAREAGSPPLHLRDGRLVVALDGNGVARFVHFDDPGAALRPGEHLLRFHLRRGRVRIGPDAFFFQEGKAALYGRAVYGELRVDASGDAVLVGLRDLNFRPLEPGGD